MQVPPLQESEVHGLPSLHTIGVPTQKPLPQSSPRVQGLPSSQPTPLSAE